MLIPPDLNVFCARAAGCNEFHMVFFVVFICSVSQSLRGSWSQNHFFLSGGLS